MPTVSRALRDEALKLLDGRGAILDTARELTGILREAGLPGSVIGVVAAVLHGYVRTTIDVDVLVESPGPVRDVIETKDFVFDAARREFAKGGIPVHLVTTEQAGASPEPSVEIDGVRTVPLEVLIATKLRSGLRDRLRAQDMADVIGLIRGRDLTARFAAELPKELRPEFRSLVKAIREAPE